MNRYLKIALYPILLVVGFFLGTVGSANMDEDIYNRKNFIQNKVLEQVQPSVRAGQNIVVATTKQEYSASGGLVLIEVPFRHPDDRQFNVIVWSALDTNTDNPTFHFTELPRK